MYLEWFAKCDHRCLNIGADSSLKYIKTYTSVAPLYSYWISSAKYFTKSIVDSLPDCSNLKSVDNWANR